MSPSRRKPAACKAPHAPGVQLQQRMRALGALRREELAALARRGRGRGAISEDYVRYVAKRSPPDALPDRVWEFLIEGGTGLRKSDLMWAVPALAAYIDATAPTKLTDAAYLQLKTEWNYVADYLRGTRSKARGPWPEIIQRSHQWHRRENRAKKRKEARALMLGRKPANKPFIQFPDGAFAVELVKGELDLEGEACAHCMDVGYAHLRNVSLRSKQNLPFFSGTFAVSDDGGVRFQQTKGNWNLIPPRATPYARAAWKAITAKLGKINSVESVSDFAALWLPKPLTDQRRFDHDTLATAGTAAFAAFVKGALEIAEPAVVGQVTSGRLPETTSPDVVVARFQALLAFSEPAAIAFAYTLSPKLFKPLTGMKEIPAALTLMQAGKTAISPLSTRRVRDLNTPRQPQPLLAEHAATWRRAATKMGFESAAALDEGGFAAWLLLAPRSAVWPLMLEAARQPKTSRLLQIVESVAHGTAGAAVEEAFMYRAVQLPRRDLRLLARSMAYNWREAVRWLRPEVEATFQGGIQSVLAGSMEIGESPRLMARVASLSPRRYTHLVQQVIRRIEATNWDWYDQSMGAYAGDRPEDEIAEDYRRIGEWGSTLWTLINMDPRRIHDATLLEAVPLGVMLERAITECAVDYQGSVVDALGEALGRLALKVAAGEARSMDLLHPLHGDQHHALGMVEAGIRTIVVGGGAGSIPAVKALVDWLERSSDDMGWSAWSEFYSATDRAKHFPAQVWATDITDSFYDPPGHDSRNAITTPELAAAKLFADTHQLPYGPFVAAYTAQLKRAS